MDKRLWIKEAKNKLQTVFEMFASHLVLLNYTEIHTWKSGSVFVVPADRHVYLLHVTALDGALWYRQHHACNTNTHYCQHAPKLCSAIFTWLISPPYFEFYALRVKNRSNIVNLSIKAQPKIITIFINSYPWIANRKTTKQKKTTKSSSRKSIKGRNTAKSHRKDGWNIAFLPRSKS